MTKKVQARQTNLFSKDGLSPKYIAREGGQVSIFKNVLGKHTRNDKAVVDSVWGQEMKSPSTGVVLPCPFSFAQVYADYESNPQLRQAIEFACRQFYILHRKPFILQLFASVAPLLEFPVSKSGSLVSAWASLCTQLPPLH